MKQGRYDFVFSLGAACLCTETLRAAGLQYASYPLDWTRGGGIRERADLVADGFPGWFEEKDFEPIPNPDAFGHDPYRNVATGMIFPHEFEKGIPLGESYPAVREKIDRRVARLRLRLQSAQRVLVVWISDPQTQEDLGDDDFRYVLDRLSAAYPQTVFELFVIDYARGISADARQERAGDRYRLVAFDYKRHGEGEPVWSVRPELLLPLFADLCAADYRTAEERRRDRLARRRRKYARFGAKTFFGYQFAKLCHEVRKRL